MKIHAREPRFFPEQPLFFPNQMVYLYNYMTGFYDPGYVTEDTRRDASGEFIYFLDVFPGGPQMIGRERDIMDAQEFAGRAARN